jgi:CRP-like cAMP-binding protein
MLHEGDFFGEMALLGNQVRKATVTAVHACTLLRLTRRDVLKLSGEFPEVARQLKETGAARTEALPPV